MCFHSVIYIIADKTNPPLFTTLSLTAAYNHIPSGNNDNIVIQAALGSEYFNEDVTHFLFTIGDGKQTNFNGNSYINSPLSAGTSYELSYYILFYDENGVRTNTKITSKSVTLLHNVSGSISCLHDPVSTYLIPNLSPYYVTSLFSIHKQFYRLHFPDKFPSTKSPTM